MSDQQLDKMKEADTMLRYKHEALRSLSPPEVYRHAPWDLLHSAMGISTEAGELMDVLKRHCFYGTGKDLDLVNLKEEYGDILWYVALGCKFLDCTIAELMDMNIRKLYKRYPEQFDALKAEMRDLTGERTELEAPQGDVEGSTFVALENVDPSDPESMKRAEEALRSLQARRNKDVGNGTHVLDDATKALATQLGKQRAIAIEKLMRGDLEYPVCGNQDKDQEDPGPIPDYVDPGLDERIYNMCRDLQPDVEQMCHNLQADGDDENHHRYLMLINALDAFCETEGQW